MDDDIKVNPATWWYWHLSAEIIAGLEIVPLLVLASKGDQVVGFRVFSLHLEPF